MTAPLVLVVPREAAGARLDRFLAAALSPLGDAPSRAELQRWIQHGRVTVDGDSRKAADKLREGAQVVVEPEPPPASSAVAEEGIAFEILHVDEAIVVIDKPAGLVVHPAKGHASGTLVNGLLARGLFDLGNENWAEPSEKEFARPGIVHRLDKGTSGIMVVARTSRSREHLKGQFSQHSIEREYEAICAGEVQAGVYDTTHGRHPVDRMRFTSRLSSGKRAVTSVRVLETFAVGLATHVTCTLETGRTHQIRVHLSEAGTPILADSLYGKRPKDPELRGIAATLGRPALHARVLGFVHPSTGRPVRFEVPPPRDFAEALRALREIAT